MVGCLCLALTHEKLIWFDKCVKNLHGVRFHGTWTHEVCILFFTMNTSYRVSFLSLSKTICIHLIGDSNTKCTYLGGVHPMVYDFGE
jgi:hypothetical protein